MVERSRFTLDNATDFFEFNGTIKDLLALVYDRNLQSTVYDAFYKVMAPQFGADTQECYESRFYSYGLFGLLDEWVKRGFNETPAQMAKITNIIIVKNKTAVAD